MTRDKALEVSAALVAVGRTHSIVVGVHDGHLPRERYSVNVTPALAFSAVNISALQRLADNLRCEIAYCNGSFTFTETGA